MTIPAAAPATPDEGGPPHEGERMHDPELQLTPLQRGAVDFARRDLDSSRAADLAAIDAASLILLVERLRGRLDSVLQLLDEVSEQAAPARPPGAASSDP